MAYANARVINDADSHIMESLDWLTSHADPDMRDRLGSMRLEAGGSGAEKAIAKALARQQDAVATAEIAANVVTGPKGLGGLWRDRSRGTDQGAGRPRLRAPAGVHHLRRFAVPALARPGCEIRRRAGAEPGDGRILRRPTSA